MPSKQVALEIEHKWLLARRPDRLLLGHPIRIEQIYLEVYRGSSSRIRRTSLNGRERYFRTLKTLVSPGVCQEQEYEITVFDYEYLRTSADPSRQPIYKNRYHVHYRQQRFEVDDILRPRSRACVLAELEVADLSTPVDMPPFFEVEREVTGETEFANSCIALG